VNELETCGQFAELINFLRDYNIPFLHKNDVDLDQVVDGQTANWDEIASMLFLRMALQQFPYQQSPLTSLYRYQWFYSYDRQNLNLADKFEREFFFPFDSYVFICFLLFVLSENNSNLLTFDYLIQQLKGQKSFKSEEVIIMINQICATRENICENFFQLKSSDERMINFEFNSLKINPIIVAGLNEFFIPLPQLLFHAITQGFYHQLCDKYSDEQFRENFGKEIFELYVEHVISWGKADYDVIPEFFYNKGKRSADFTLVRENDLILIEVKGTTPKTYLSSTDLKIFVDQLNKAYAVGVTQCAKKEVEIRNGTLNHSLFPKSIDKIHYLIITLEDFYFFPTPFVLKTIKEYALSKGATIDDRKTFHLMSINTLEHILEHDKRSLFDFLAYRDCVNHTFSVAPWIDVKPKEQNTEQRSRQYLNKIIDKYMKNQ